MKSRQIVVGSWRIEVVGHIPGTRRGIAGCFASGGFAVIEAHYLFPLVGAPALYVAGAIVMGGMGASAYGAEVICIRHDRPISEAVETALDEAADGIEADGLALDPAVDADVVGDTETVSQPAELAAVTEEGDRWVCCS